MMAWLAGLNTLDWNALDVRDAGDWPRPAQWLALAALAIGAFWAAWVLHVGGKRDALAASEDEEGELKAIYRERALQTAGFAVLERRVAALDAAFTAFLATLPADAEVPGLVEDIAQAAAVNRLLLERIALQPERRGAQTLELPIQLTLTGDFHQLGAFASAVANLPRLVTLHDFELAPLDGTPTLRISVLAKTYRHQPTP